METLGKTQEPTQAQTLSASEGYCRAKEALLAEIVAGSARVAAVKGPTLEGDEKTRYMQTLQLYNADRGRDLYFPFLSSGLGHGPFVELRDGSVKYDMITGIGINFFGHTHPAFVRAMMDGLTSDVMQGNLQPGYEAQELVRELVSVASVAGAPMKHAWLTTCGTMANEIALKIIRQKRFPATRVFAFEDCFSGRSTAMQELTDNPKYREGQPVYGEVHHLPFYSEKQGLARSVQATLENMKAELDRYPGKFCAIMMELIQGEGGFRAAPAEFYVRVFEEAKKRGLAVWIDEIQTFGRTGELFAFQKFGLEKWIDVVTVGKMLQACAVIYTGEFNPRPGLVAGTFTGSSVALKTARETLRLLRDGGFLGPDGVIERLSKRFVERLRGLADSSGKIGEIRAVGGMIAFEPTPGTLDSCKAVLMRLFDLGVVAFYCGHGPYLIRMLPPLGAMTDTQVDEVCELIGKAL